jgi:hypothetical protein
VNPVEQCAHRGLILFQVVHIEQQSQAQRAVQLFSQLVGLLGCAQQMVRSVSPAERLEYERHIRPLGPLECPGQIGLCGRLVLY